MSDAKADESLQAFAMKIKRLVQLAYPGKNHPLIDFYKTEVFIYGIRDPDIKLAVCSTLKRDRGLRTGPSDRSNDL